MALLSAEGGCEQNSSRIKEMSTGAGCQRDDLLYSLEGLAAPSRIPPQQRRHFVFISCRKCHSSLHLNDISFVYSVFTAIAPNGQHKQTKTRICHERL